MDKVFIWIEASDYQGRSREESLTFTEDVEAISRIKASFKSPNDWLSYLFPLSESGKYILWIRYKSLGGALANFHLDNKILSFGTKIPSTEGSYHWMRLGEESLKKVEEGSHFLRIELLSGYLDLDIILLTNDLSLIPESKSKYIDQEILEKRQTLIKEIKGKIATHRKLKVATIQYAACATLGPQERIGMRRDEYRLAKIGAIIDKAASLGAEILCLPECITLPGSGRGTIQEGESWWEPETVPGGWSVEYIRKKAKENKIYIVGWAWEMEKESQYNTAYIINRNGEIIGKYRKVHPCGPWEAGNNFPVFETDFGKIGILICYDMQFPEAARILSLKGAEIIFYPLAGDERGNSEWEIMTRARAIDNNIYIVASPLSEVAGLIVDLDGSVIARTDIRGNDLGCAEDYDKYIIEHKESLEGKGIAIAEIDLDKIKGHGGINNRRENIIKDRHPEAYKEIINPSYCRGEKIPVKLEKEMYLR